jgi:hypothetical protein
MKPIVKAALKVGAGIAINAVVGYVVMASAGSVDVKEVAEAAKDFAKKAHVPLGLPTFKKLKG